MLLNLYFPVSSPINDHKKYQAEGRREYVQIAYVSENLRSCNFNIV